MKTMKTKFQIALSAATFISMCSSFAVADDTAAGSTSEANKPGLVQALDKAHEAAGAVSSHGDDIAKQASTVTDDEGMAEEDMEMPEEDLDIAPPGNQAE